MYGMNLDEGMVNVEWVSLIISILYLAALSIQDLRNRTVSGKLLAIGMVYAVLFQILWGEQLLSEWLLGAFVGICFIGVSKITKEALGYGDSLLILNLGIYLGIWKLMYLLLIAFAISGVFSIAILIKCHYHKKKTFPFIPFLAAGYVLLMILSYTGS